MLGMKLPWHSKTVLKIQLAAHLEFACTGSVRFVLKFAHPPFSYHLASVEQVLN